MKNGKKRAARPATEEVLARRAVKKFAKSLQRFGFSQRAALSTIVKTTVVRLCKRYPDHIGAWLSEVDGLELAVLNAATSEQLEALACRLWELEERLIVRYGTPEPLASRVVVH